MRKNRNCEMSSVKDQNAVFWTRYVPGWDRTGSAKEGTPEFHKSAMDYRYASEPYLEGFFQRILKPGYASLEVGCGIGCDVATFASRGLAATGLDYSPENASLSQLGLDAFNLPGLAIAGDAEQLPFPDNSFDIVWSWGVLHHTPKTQLSIDEVYRVLRPGGQAAIGLYHKGYQYLYMLAAYAAGFRWLRQDLQSYLSWRYDKTPLSQFFSRAEMRHMFRRFLNVDIEVTTYGGIQYHPILKHVWRAFQLCPFLLCRLGSFIIAFATKPGDAPPLLKAPSPCCPVCKGVLKNEVGGLRCLDVSCGATYPLHKGRIPVLHPQGQEVCRRWLEDWKSGPPPNI